MGQPRQESKGERKSTFRGGSGGEEEVGWLRRRKKADLGWGEVAGEISRLLCQVQRKESWVIDMERQAGDGV